MSVSHYTTTGRFNLLSSEKQQQVVLHTEFGIVADTWELDSAPYDPDMTPSEVSALLRDRIKSYLYRGGAEKCLAILDQVDANAAMLDCEWLDKRASKLEAEAKWLRERIKQIGGAT